LAHAGERFCAYDACDLADSFVGWDVVVEAADDARIDLLLAERYGYAGANRNAVTPLLAHLESEGLKRKR
jgi:hypothetical protein